MWTHGLPSWRMAGRSRGIVEDSNDLHEPFAVAFELVGAHAVDLEELLRRVWVPFGHVAQCAIRENNVGRFAYLACDLHAQGTQVLEQFRVHAGVGAQSCGGTFAGAQFRGLRVSAAAS